MNNLISLAKSLSNLGLNSHSKLIIKLAGEMEAKYLEDLNFKVWVKGKGEPPSGNSKEFWSNPQREFKERKEGGPIFDSKTISLIREFDSNRVPRDGRKTFVKWLARWIGEWGELPNSDQNTILDWWSITGGVEKGRPFDDKMIEMLTPAYSLQRAEEYHNDEGFYFDPTEKYLTPPNKNVIHDFGDGFKIVYVPAVGEMQQYELSDEDKSSLDQPNKKTSYDRVIEGNKMGICLGKKMRLYQDNGGGKVYSLRDSKNDPCVTIRADDYFEEEPDDGVDSDDPDYEPMDYSKRIFRVLEFQGLGNSVPSKKYADYILRFFRHIDGYDEVDISDRYTYALTKMNSKDQGQRISAMREAYNQTYFSRGIFSTDWKTLEKDDPILFKEIIVKSIFTLSLDDELDPAKLGGDDQKKDLIKANWKNYVGNAYITKKILFTFGNELLIKIVPELLEATPISKILFPADTASFFKKLEEDNELREFIWSNKVLLSPPSLLKIHDAQRIVECFKNEIIKDGGKSDAVKMIVKLLLEDKNNSVKIGMALVSIEPVIISVIDSTPEIIPSTINGTGRLNNLTIDSIRFRIMESLYGVSPFSIPLMVMKSGLTLERNDYLKIFEKSNKTACGNTKEIYDLIQFIKGGLIKANPLDIFDLDFWKKCLIKDLKDAQLNEVSSQLWIFSAQMISGEVKEVLFEALKENMNFLKFAYRTYMLGTFFSKEEIQKLLDHHGLVGKSESQF